jgi:hypothetical protein
MRATSVIARFLSLLDVALILLGLLMIMLTKAQLGEGAAELPVEAEPGLADLANVQFVYLVAGWRGEKDGKCFLLGPDRKWDREIRGDRDTDIKQLTQTRSGDGKPVTPVVMLLFAEDGWFSAWDESKLKQLESVWQVDVVPVYNVRLPQD